MITETLQDLILKQLPTNQPNEPNRRRWKNWISDVILVFTPGPPRFRAFRLRHDCVSSLSEYAKPSLNSRLVRPGETQHKKRTVPIGGSPLVPKRVRCGFVFIWRKRKLPGSDRLSSRREQVFPLAQEQHVDVPEAVPAHRRLVLASVSLVKGASVWLAPSPQVPAAQRVEAWAVDL